MATPKTFTVAESDKYTVGNLDAIIKKLKDRIANPSVSKSSAKAAEKLIKKYIQAKTKATRYYEKNKQNEKIKPYRVYQLSYAKMRELVTGEKAKSNGNDFDNHATNSRAGNWIMGIGAGMATIGIINKLKGDLSWTQLLFGTKAGGPAILTNLAKFLFTNGAAPITIGVGAIAGVLLWRLIKKRQDKVRDEKYAAESEILEQDNHENKIETAGKTEIHDYINKAYKDPLLLEQIEEIALDTSGRYTKDQVDNAAKILTGVRAMRNKAQHNAVGNAMQSALLNTENKDLINTFEAYNSHNEKYAQAKKYIEEFSFENERAAEEKGEKASYNKVNNATDSGKYDASKVSNITGTKPADIDTLAKDYILDTGEVDISKLQANISKDSNDMVDTTSEYFVGLVDFIKEKCSKKIFEINKQEAMNADPEYKKYVEAKENKPKADSTITAGQTKFVTSYFEKTNASSGTKSDTYGSNSLTLHKILTGNLDTVLKLIKDFASAMHDNMVDPKNQATYIDDWDSLIDKLYKKVEKDIVSSYKTNDTEIAKVKEYLANFPAIKELKDLAEAYKTRATSEKDINALESPTIKVVDANGNTNNKKLKDHLYDQLIAKLSNGDPEKKAELQTKFKSMEDLEAAYGKQLKEAGQMMKDSGMIK